MLTYSRQQMERQLIADQALWSQVPAAAGAVLWPLEIVLLGWDTGWWAGLATVVTLSVLSEILPSRIAASIYHIDLLERIVTLPLDLGWLLVLWHLWLREPRFPILGQAPAGAVVAALSLWAITRLLAPIIRFTSRRVVPRRPS